MAPKFWWRAASAHGWPQPLTRHRSIRAPPPITASNSIKRVAVAIRVEPSISPSWQACPLSQGRNTLPAAIAVQTTENNTGPAGGHRRAGRGHAGWQRQEHARPHAPLSRQPQRPGNARPESKRNACSARCTETKQNIELSSSPPPESRRGAQDMSIAAQKHSPMSPRSPPWQPGHQGNPHTLEPLVCSRRAPRLNICNPLESRFIPLCSLAARRRPGASLLRLKAATGSLPPQLG